MLTSSQQYNALHSNVYNPQSHMMSVPDVLLRGHNHNNAALTAWPAPDLLSSVLSTHFMRVKVYQMP